MRIPNHPGDAGQLGELLGGALGVAAGNKDAGVGAAPVDPPDRLAQLIVGGGGDGARIQDHQIGFLELAGGLHSPGGQARFQGGAVGLRGSAPKRFYEKPLQTVIVSFGGFGPGFPGVSAGTIPGWAPARNI